jgi:hypothetical protein
MGILGFIDTGGASVHADVGLQNVVVGEELTLFSGKRNVVLGSKAGLSATRSEDNFLWDMEVQATVMSWNESRSILERIYSYSVIVGPLAASVRP